MGYDLPAASTARQWLDRFHEETALAGRPQQGSFIPAESAALAGLRAVVQHTVRAYGAAVQPGRPVTLEVDAPLVESSKRSALPTDEGFRGYQPLLVEWAETGLVLADEFRAGNVPASRNIRELVDEAYAALPARDADDDWQVSVRSDSAAYDQQVWDHWQGRGWRFAVSADMSSQLRREILALEPEAWRFWTQEATGVVREWAEVPFVPSRADEKRNTPPYRYTYTASIHVRQYGPWLQITQPEDNISYYGQCTGSSIQLDVYSGGQFIGYENGTVSISGPGWEMTVRARWASYTPSYIAGNETWQRW